MFAVGGFGPCGPSNPLGSVGWLAHLLPGAVVAWMLESGLAAHGAILVVAAVASQAAFWIVLAHLLRFRPRKPR
jgi:hypothetical protein